MGFICDTVPYGDGAGLFIVIIGTLVTIIVCLAVSRGRHKRNSEKLQEQYGEYLE